MDLKNYKGKHRFKFEALDFACVIVIDFDCRKTDGGPGNDIYYRIKEMVEFWSGWRTDLQEHDGDYVFAFAHRLAEQVGLCSIQDQGGIETREGYLHWVTPEYGITIIDGHWSPDLEVELAEHTEE